MMFLFSKILPLLLLPLGVAMLLGVWERWWNLGPLMQGPLDAPWIDGLGRRCGLRCVMC